MTKPAFRIDIKTARAALPARREPYFVRLSPGVYLGYRVLPDGAGTWIGRRRDPDSGRQQYRTEGALADVLDDERYEAAKKRVEQWAAGLEAGVQHKAGTVADAVDLYVAHLARKNSQSSADTNAARFRTLIGKNPIARVMLDQLKAQQVQRWFDALVRVEDARDAEHLRRMKSSANRDLSRLKAALNNAFRLHLVSSDIAWRRVQKYKDVEGRREVVLDAKARAALLKGASTEIRPFLQALLLTGARPGEVAKLTVAMFDRKAGTLAIPKGKTKARLVTLSTQAIAFFAAQAKGKTPAAPLIARADGSAWRSANDWGPLVKDAAAAAGLPPGTVAYCLRHTTVSEWILAGVDLLVVARSVGTSLTMIDKHYGHLINAKTVREKLDRIAMC
ncbi:integrase [Cupriavidus metallidurans]|jgi:integrase|uniref:tyrosine-type recombinase/integrase n=1 Tax=Cupriavidus TaxID=106589 RepID=UPI000492F237|nr:tyrosine-type recombinase/integrase [Cupriavidus metallidurans]KWW35568.1 Tyrosine recombinase XerC [Cupriavidus metallidurans]MDE4921707.1 tyrosine-type recombinase/integrase [Cupriavidus metallidurans]